jgi:hypothetical protein
MELIISESQLKRIIEQSVVGAPNYGQTSSTNTMGTQKQSNSLKSNILPFTPENLKSEIQKQGIIHPDVAMAQATWESGHFGSPIFKENNNLFGMKLAHQRKTTAIGKNRGHAKYNNWQDSVKDYKLWQDSNGMSNLPKDQYIKKLSDIYCSPPDCVRGSYGKNIQKMIGWG